LIHPMKSSLLQVRRRFTSSIPLHDNQDSLPRKPVRCNACYRSCVQLGTEEKLHFCHFGYVKVERVVPAERMDLALRQINLDLGRGLEPSRIEDFYARSFCPELRNSDAILDLYRQSPARELADSLVLPARLRAPSMAQIALRFPEAREAVLPRPHVDGSYGARNGVKAGTVAHFTLLAMVALSDVEHDFAGNGTPKLPNLPAPVQVRVRKGDLLLSHYQLGHAPAPNLSSHVRYAVFFRLYHEAHDADDLGILADIWREFPSLRSQ
jgi:hypothetical protein